MKLKLPKIPHTKYHILNTKRLFPFAALLLIFAGSIIAYSLYHPTKSQAAWFNDNWAYRKAITVTNSNSAASTNIQKLISVDTATLISSGKLQIQCQDLRFTSYTGAILPYYIDSGCNTSATKIWVLVDSLPTSTSTILMYYGNPGVVIGQTQLNSTTSLVGYWPMEDQAGTTVTDASTTANNGTTSGTSVTGGRIGNARNFAGADRIQVPYNAATDLGTGDFTIELWTKLNATGITNMFFSNYNANPSYMQGYVNSSNKLVYLLRDAGGTTNAITGNTTFTTNQWYHLTFTRTGSTMRFYINGTEETLSSGSNTSAPTGDIWQGTAKLDIGAESTNGAQSTFSSLANAVIDDLRIYSALRSTTQISADYSTTFQTGSNTEKFDNLIALKGYWTANDTSGTTVTDSSLVANSGTATGATIVTGQKGNARQFASASSQRVQIPYNSNLDPGSSDYTIQLWFKPTTINVSHLLVSNYNTTSPFMQAYVNSSNKLIFRIRGTANTIQTITGNTSLSAGTWYHLTFTRSSTQMKIFINGGEETLSSGATTDAAGATGDNWDNSAKLDIGAESTNAGQTTFSTYANGIIDDVKIHHNVRTDAQILADYTNSYTIQTAEISITTSIGSEEKAPQPVAYWKFDDGQGTTAQDSTTNNKDGTLTGPPTWQTEDQCVSGKCLRFNGSSQYVDMGNQTAHQITGQLTLEAWINPTSLSAANSGGIIAKFRSQTGNTNQRSYALVLNPTTDTVDFVLSSDGTSATNKTVASTTTLTTNTWYHIVATYTPSTSMKIYLNGKLDKTDTSSIPSAIFNSAAPLWVGTQFDSTNSTVFFPGTIDEPKIYNYVLSDAQVQADYNARGNPQGAAGVLGSSFGNNTNALSNGLAGYWKMDQSSWNGTSGEVIDSSGNGNNGTSTKLGSPGVPSTTIGKYGNGGSFTGTSNGNAQHVTIGNVLNMTASQSFTISTWAKYATQTSSNNYPSLINKGNTQDGTAYYNIGVNTDGVGQAADNKVGFTIRDGTTAVNVSTLTAKNDSTWHLYTGTVDRSTQTLSFYTDGILQGTANISAIGSLSNSRSLAIGVRDATAGLANGFTGTIDEARIYNRALSSADAQALYNFAPGPVGYWDMEENFGSSFLDKSGNANNLTLVRPAWDQGKFGSAYSMNGTTNNRLAYLTSPGATLKPANLTVSAWVNPKSLTDGYVVAEQPRGEWNDGRGYQLNITGGGKATFALGSASGSRVSATGATTLSLNNWYHLSGTYDGTTIKIYVNGVLDGSTSSSITISYADNTSFGPNPQTFYIGLQHNSTSTAQDTLADLHFFNGLIDDVKVYNYARIQKQVVSDMNAGHPSVGSPVGSPLGYWRFNEGTGTSTGNSGNGGSALNGTLTNITSPATSTSGWSQAGKFGKALNFDGTNDYVTTNSDTPFDFTSDFSLSLWLKSSSSSGSGFRGILGKYNTTATGWDLSQTTTTGKLRMTLRGTSNLDNLGVGNDLRDNTWHHIVVVNTPTSISTYTDGNLVNTTTGTWTAATNNVNVTIGAREIDTANTTPFMGSLDEVKIYPYALTASEVQLDMNQGQAVSNGSLGNNSTYQANSANQEYCVPGDATSCAAPVGRWDFQEKSGSSVLDSSGNANTGTISGSTFTKGKFGGGLNLDGTNDYVEFPHSASLDLDSGTGLTIESWVYLPTGGGGAVLGKWDNGTGRQYVVYFNTSALTLSVSSNGSQRATRTTSGVSLATNRWYHIAAIWKNDATIALYINGQSQTIVDAGSSQAIPSSLYGSSTLKECIGLDLSTASSCSTPGTSLFTMDQLLVFNYARTATQVAWDYNKGGPVALYRMDECQGSTINDSSGNGQTGTLTVGSSGTQSSIGTCTTSSTAWGNGATEKYNSSLNFDGTDDYANTTNTLNLSKTNIITLSFWLNWAAYADDNDLAMEFSSNFNNNDGAFLIDPNSGNGGSEFEVSIQDGVSTSRYRSETFPRPSAGTWHHYGIILNNSTTTGDVIVYMDGRLQATTILSNTKDQSSNFRNDTLYFMSRAGSTFFGQGKLDDVRIYNYALTSSQIQLLYNNNSASFTGPVTGSP